MDQEMKKIGECDCCGYEEIEVARYDVSFYGDESEFENYCDICAGTYFSLMSRGQDSRLPKSLGYAFNMALAELREIRKLLEDQK
jgi:hypothetical protein